MSQTRSSVRRGALQAFLTAIVTTGSAMPLVAQPEPAQDRRPVVALLDYIDASLRTDANYKVLGKGIAAVLASRLGESGIRIVTREKLQDVLTEQNLGTSGRVDPEQAVRVGHVLGAHHIIYGAYMVQPNGDTRLTAQAYSVETTEQEYATSVRGPADKMQDLLDQLADKMIAGMHLPDASLRTPAARAPASTGSLGELVILSRAVDAEDRKNPAEAAPLYKLFLAKSPATSFVAQRRLAEARVDQIGGGGK